MYRKVSPGNQLSGYPASVYNATVELIEKDRLRGTSRRLETGPESISVLVQNNTGTAVGRYEVLAISSTMIDPANNEEEFNSHIVLHGDTPAEGDTFVITQETIANGALGLALFVGVTQCSIDVIESDHQYCEIKDGDSSELQSSTSGPAKIIWKASGTGTQRAVILLGVGQRSMAVPLDLTQVGGSQGDTSTEPSWTYDVYPALDRDDSPDALLLAANPTSSHHKWRRHKGQMSAADFGWGYINSDGLLEITWINEILIADECGPVGTTSPESVSSPLPDWGQGVGDGSGDVGDDGGGGNGGGGGGPGLGGGD